MDISNRIIVLGFGRSGTTWISDIISKCLGGLILFEPLHPEAFPYAKEACYHDCSNEGLLNKIDHQLNQCLNKKNKNRWLLRNHISAKLEDISTSYVSDVWKECNVIGFKAIRANFMIPHLHENYTDKIVFIKRHPCAVISSILNRANFWKEFGLQFHLDKFKKEVLSNSRYTYIDQEKLIYILESLSDAYLQMAFMWSVTHLVIEKQLKDFNLPLFKYEDFYINPYESTRKLMTFLTNGPVNIHPSYLFTPSMLTLKTLHEFRDDSNFITENNFRLFWQNTITSEMEMKINDVIDRVNKCSLV